LGQDSIFIKDRISQYFTNQPGLEKPYRTARDHLPDDCSRVGLILGGDSWEYPLWVLGKISRPQLMMQHINVENDSNKYTSQDFIPCAIIDTTQNPEEQITLNGVVYSQIYNRFPVSVYVAPGLNGVSP
jgi:hypothetical protein